jgi:hypothetical protein
MHDMPFSILYRRYLFSRELPAHGKLQLPTCHSRHTRDNSACGMTSQHTCRACPFDCHTRQYLSTGRVILCSHMAYAAKSRFANLCSILGGPHRVMARPSMYDDGTTHKGHWECAPPRAIPDVVRISVTPKIQCQSRFGHQRHLLAGH